MKLIDGLSDIFTETFGESVNYTPDGGIPIGIEAIWIETPISAAFESADTDAVVVELHVRAADIAAPKEGDIVQRVSDSKTMRVTQPIRPDEQGMIVLTLEQAD